MRRLFVIPAAAFALALPASATTHPSLSVVRGHPLAVRGAGFAARERVVVRTADFRVVVRTTALGRFLATFTATDRCSTGRIIAVGATGDRAVLRLPPLECAPAATP